MDFLRFVIFACPHTNLLTRQRQLMIASRNNIGYVCSLIITLVVDKFFRQIAAAHSHEPASGMGELKGKFTDAAYRGAHFEKLRILKNMTKPLQKICISKI
jgi:fructose-bisphosphate aldolase class 1